MITAIQVDDEANAREFLRTRLREVAAEVQVVGEGSNIEEAQRLISQMRPQLLFLDVQMPGGDGFELLRRLGHWDFQVIFTTGHAHYAIQAIRFSALDYLLKPVQADELRAALERFHERSSAAPTEIQQRFLENVATGEERALKLTLTHGDRTHAVPPEDIAWCEADRNYTALHLIDERRFVSARTLKDYDEMLTPFGFLRVHKSALVNRRHVEGIDKEGHVRLRNGHRVEISRRRFEEVVHALRS